MTLIHMKNKIMDCLELERSFTGLNRLLAEAPGKVLHATYSVLSSPKLLLCDQAVMNHSSIESKLLQKNPGKKLFSHRCRSSLLQMKQNERLQLEKNKLCFHKNLREKLKRSYTGGTLECGGTYGSAYPQNKEVSPD